MKSELLKQIPQVDALIRRVPPYYFQKFEMKHIKHAVQIEVDQLRREILANACERISEEALLMAVRHRLDVLLTDTLIPVINATGIVIHTNLGRAVLPKQIVEEATDVLTNYTTLEFNLETGQRGSRYVHAERRLVELTGAEAALVVNNNAAAVMLILNTLAAGREVIVSRGELVEIGGSFRIPDVMAASGCCLKEVGTTNKTHLYDYEQAIGTQTALLMKTHTSNYKIIGFTAAVETDKLVEVGKKYEIPVYEDLGSGAVYAVDGVKLPRISSVLETGVDVLSFSGDKVFGSVQCGVILGKKKWIDSLKRNPMLRAFRMDKYTLALLEVTLRHYLKRETVFEMMPALKMIVADQETVHSAALRFVNHYAARLAACQFKWALEPCISQIGGGSTPDEGLPSYGLEIHAVGSSDRFQRRLRAFKKPIISVVSKDCIYLDFRTIFQHDYEMLMEGLEFADA